MLSHDAEIPNHTIHISEIHANMALVRVGTISRDPNFKITANFYPQTSMSAK
jgi:hypothetical protein